MSRVQDLNDLFPEYAQLAIETADPKHKNKYLMWIATQLSNKHSQEDIKSTVNAFHRNCKRLNSQDIYTYKDLKDLENEIKDLDMSKRQAEIFTKEMGAVKVYSDDLCTLVRINSKQAMLYYGKASRWCVAMEREEYWEDYSSSGNVFYVLIDKSNSRKYAIQKCGLMDVTVWREDDNSEEIDDWIKKNNRFEKAIFACLHDREEPMLFRIKRKNTTREEVLEWIKYQHQSTIKYLKKHIKESALYFIDLTSPVSVDTLSNLFNISKKDLEKLQQENPEYIENVVKFLSKNPKIKAKWLRVKLGGIIENPELILSEEDANFIKMKRDSSLATKLLSSTNPKIWKKALEVASPAVILSVLPSISNSSKSKRSNFVQKLKNRTNYEKLIDWLSKSDFVSKIPDNVWSSKSQYNDYDDGDDYDGDDYDEDEEDDF